MQVKKPATTKKINNQLQVRIRPHLDYNDIIYKLKSIYYNPYITIMGATRGNPTDKLNQELGLGSIPFDRWYSTLCGFYKIFKDI